MINNIFLKRNLYLQIFTCTLKILTPEDLKKNLTDRVMGAPWFVGNSQLLRDAPLVIDF